MVQKLIPFRPKARLMNVVGKDLIKDEVAGVIELVKNAYDADASAVTIRMVDLDDNDEKSIQIEDDGCGMDDDTIINKWMVPATESKRRHDISPIKGRPVLGMMGIGRFSVMRLGKKLKLETTKKDLKEIYQLNINWDEFNEDEKYLEDIKIDYKTVEKTEDNNYSTLLTISGLNDDWTVQKVENLIKELRHLISPININDENDFSIIVDLTASCLPDESITSTPILITPIEVENIDDYSIEAEIEASGQYKWTYRRMLLSEEDAHEVSKMESGDVRDLLADEPGLIIKRPLICGPLKIKLNVRDRDKNIIEKKLATMSGPEKLGVNDYKRVLDERSGIGIFRDGFRVRPYGDADQDWLSLAQRRVQNPTLRLSPNQLFGFVQITRKDNGNLMDKSSREGLVENDAYRLLKAIVRAILSRVEPLRYSFRKRKGFGRAPEHSLAYLSEKREQNIEEMTDLIKKEIKDEKLVNKINNKIADVTKSIENEHDSISMQAEVMHTQHALGVLAEYVIHESRNIEANLHSSLRVMERRTSKSKEALEGKALYLTDKALVEFDDAFETAKSVDQRLDDLISDLDPVTRKRKGKIPKTNVKMIIDNVLTILGPNLRKARVSIEKPVDNIEVLVHDADCFLIIFNLLHNSSYWVMKNKNDRKISITIREITHEIDGEGPITFCEILIRDNGSGVPENEAPSIFDIGYSTKPNGRGMGLFLAREAARRARGSVDLANPGAPGAVFRVLLRKA